MARKPLRSQLNQIRAWVRQGRTDAWIAHQLDVSASDEDLDGVADTVTSDTDLGDIADYAAPAPDTAADDINS